jgi:hypothetical protein
MINKSEIIKEKNRLIKKDYSVLKDNMLKNLIKDKYSPYAYDNVVKQLVAN